MTTPRVWQALALLLCAVFVASVARLYHPEFGFSGLIAFPEGHDDELPALRELPHQEYPSSAVYDGQFYAQLALDPLLRDPAIDRALDLPAYRARRILFSWTAWGLGLGRPAWILQAYALQNVLSWLLLAWLLTRWIPPKNARLLALWTACMFSHGLLWSVRFSLVDGPSLLVLACAVLIAERQGRWSLASIVGIAALGRETNLLGAAILSPPMTRSDWLRSAGAVVLMAVPLLVWQDYLWSIYRTTSLAGGDHITTPFLAWFDSWRMSLDGVRRDGVSSPALRTLLVVIGLTVQAVFIGWSRAWRDPWWRLAAAFAVLMLVVHPEVWRGYPGAITRVVLPLTVGFNVLLARSPRGFWAWFALGNLPLLLAPQMLPAPWTWGQY